MIKRLSLLSACSVALAGIALAVGVASAEIALPFRMGFLFVLILVALVLFAMEWWKRM